MVYSDPLTIPWPMISNGSIRVFFQTSHYMHLFLCFTTPKPYLALSLSSAKQVYVRRDGINRRLQRPYTGPYVVLTSDDKTLLLDIGGCVKWISIDSLKPVFTDPLHPTTLVKPPPCGLLPVKRKQPHGHQSSLIQKKTCLTRSPDQLFHPDNTPLPSCVMTPTAWMLRAGLKMCLPLRYQ